MIQLKSALLALLALAGSASPGAARELHADLCARRCAKRCAGKRNLARCASDFVASRCAPFSARTRRAVAARCLADACAGACAAKCAAAPDLGSCAASLVAARCRELSAADQGAAAAKCLAAVCAADDGKKYCDPSSSAWQVEGTCAHRCTTAEWEDYCAGSGRIIEECEAYCAADEKNYCDPTTSVGDVVCGHCCHDGYCQDARGRMLLDCYDTCLGGECHVVCQ
jgi:hypothetical protein